MADASQTPNPLEACTRDGRDEDFQKCLACARALPALARRLPRDEAEEVPALLLRVGRRPDRHPLAGRYPPAVQEHFSKFTDNIGAIEWGADDDGKLGDRRSSRAMVSGDKETVPFGRPHCCARAPSRTGCTR